MAVSDYVIKGREGGREGERERRRVFNTHKTHTNTTPF